MHEFLIIFVVSFMTVTLTISIVLVVEAIDRRNDTPYWERKARKYERKADRLRSIRVFLSAFPFSFTEVPTYNLALFTDRYRDLAEECRRQK